MVRGAQRWAAQVPCFLDRVGPAAPFAVTASVDVMVRNRRCCDEASGRRWRCALFSLRVEGSCGLQQNLLQGSRSRCRAVCLGCRIGRHCRHGRRPVVVFVLAGYHRRPQHTAFSRRGSGKQGQLDFSKGVRQLARCQTVSGLGCLCCPAPDIRKRKTRHSRSMSVA
jgi:hypothetical protein